MMDPAVTVTYGEPSDQDVRHRRVRPSDAPDSVEVLIDIGMTRLGDKFPAQNG